MSSTSASPGRGRTPLRPRAQPAPRPWAASKITSSLPIGLFVLGHLGDDAPLKGSPMAVSEPEEATDTQKPYPKCHQGVCLLMQARWAAAKVVTRCAVHRGQCVNTRHAPALSRAPCRTRRGTQRSESSGLSWKMSTDRLAKWHRHDSSERAGAEWSPGCRVVSCGSAADPRGNGNAGVWGWQAGGRGGPARRGRAARPRQTAGRGARCGARASGSLGGLG